MSIERRIVQRLFESKNLYEAEFQAGGSTYKCAFGKYYKDGEEISRDEYFRAKETGGGSSSEPVDSKPHDQEYSEKTLSPRMKKLDTKFKEISYTFSDIGYGAPEGIYKDIQKSIKNLKNHYYKGIYSDREDSVEASEEEKSISREMVDKLEEISDRVSTLKKYSSKGMTPDQAIASIDKGLSDRLAKLPKEIAQWKKDRENKVYRESPLANAVLYIVRASKESAALSPFTSNSHDESYFRDVYDKAVAIGKEYGSSTEGLIGFDD